VRSLRAGGSGIGEATAELFGREGAKVVVVDIDEREGRPSVKNSRSNRVWPTSSWRTFRRRITRGRFSSEAVETFWRDQILSTMPRLLWSRIDATAEEWQRSLMTNVDGTAVGYQIRR